MGRLFDFRLSRLLLDVSAVFNLERAEDFGRIFIGAVCARAGGGEVDIVNRAKYFSLFQYILFDWFGSWGLSWSPFKKTNNNFNHNNII